LLLAVTRQLAAGGHSCLHAHLWQNPLIQSVPDNENSYEIKPIHIGSPS